MEHARSQVCMGYASVHTFKQFSKMVASIYTTACRIRVLFVSNIAQQEPGIVDVLHL